MADKNIGRFDLGTVTPTTHVVAIETAPEATANVDPVLIPVENLGGTGPSAYDVAVDNGFIGDEPAWLASLKGAPGNDGAPGTAGTNGANGAPGPQGSPGPSIVPNEYGTFNEAKVTQIETANVEWNVLIDVGGDTRANKTQPAALNGDMSRHLVRYEPGTPGVWRDLGPIVGVAGPAGGQGNPGTPGTPGTPGAPGAKGDPGDSAYTVAVANGYVGTQTQWLNSLKGTPGTDGTNGTNGTNGTDGTNGAPGPKGDPGATNPAYEVSIFRTAGVVPGGYPMTYHVTRAGTLVTFWGKTTDGASAQVAVTKNGANVYAATLTGTKTVVAINETVAVGDVLALDVLAGAEMPTMINAGVST